MTDKEMTLIDQSVERLRLAYRSYAENQDTSFLDKAIAFSREAHKEQKRATGEPYIIHPLAVAELLTELEMDQQSLCAALLHDTVEDTDHTKEDIVEAFGQDVADIVDGVTKLDKMSFHSKEELQAENFRKMFLAMAQDVRVVIIKLADRLHNMRTMKHLPPHKQESKSRETLEIYAPLAHRLGIYKWKWELEDLCFRYLNPTAYYELVGAISQRRSEREAYLDQVVGELSRAIEQIGIEAEIEGRPKHFYSIYKKMTIKEKTLEEVYDLFACRVIVNTVADCYAVLGLVHEKYHPMPGRFKDYIAVPKANMYQSLHTTVIGPKGLAFEVQIRTFAMHRTAEFGVAAHYNYKQGDELPKKKEDSADYKLAWLRQMLDWQKDMKDAGEYMESLRTGLLEDDVYVFTPRGDVISLPQGSVPIDFAYAIHSGVGNSMYGAKVNGRIVPLTYELQNGEIVEILVSDKVHGPSLDWLSIVKSTTAKNKIKHWFKRDMRDEDIAHGKELIEREIRKSGFTNLQLIQEKFLAPVLSRYNFNTVDDMYAGVGHGTMSVAKIVPRLRDEYIKSLPEEERNALGYRLSPSGQVIYSPGAKIAIVEDDEVGKRTAQSQQRKKNAGQQKNDFGIVVKGVDNCLVRLSRCCNPVPGDPIIGFTTRSSGVAVHRKDCSNIRTLIENANLSEKDAQLASRLIEVAWNKEDLSTHYEVELTIIARDRTHLLGDVSNAIAAEQVSIISGQMSSNKGFRAQLTLKIEVADQNQFERIVGRIKAIDGVIDVKRGN